MAVGASSTVASEQSEAKQRTTNPGVRLIGGRIYDSEKGKTCHQCRQKTRSFAASCKNEKNGKPCPLAFCHSCLKNRYGENAEEVAVLEQWSCPRCRGICNCSLCRKKQGHLPTGILLHRAKATGYSSVSELLHVNGPENFGLVKNVKDTVVSPKKRSISKKEASIASPRKKGKENKFDGIVDINLESPTPSVDVSRNIKSEESGKVQNKTLEIDGLAKCSSSPDKKPKKMKKGSSNLYADLEDVATLKGKSLHVNKKAKRNSSREDLSKLHDGGIGSGALLENRPKKPPISDVSNHNEAKPDGKGDSVLVAGDDCNAKASIEVCVESLKNKKRNANKDIEEPALKKSKIGVKQDTVKNKRNGLLSESQDLVVDTPMPIGIGLTTIDGVELPLEEDVGNALQFLEFCAAFGKTLNMKKGQSGIILQELLSGPTRVLRRSQQQSAAIQFHIQLLSLLQNESEQRPQTISPSHGKKSWLLALKKCISESPNAVDSLPIDNLDEESGGYDTLSFSTKLRILVFLCDEVLETAKIRDWIHNQEMKFAKKAKEAKERVLGAKEKEKSLKQKIMNEVAKTIVAKDGDALSVAEHEEIIRQIKAEAAQAHREKLESLNLLPKTKERDAAVRTEPIFVDVDGRAFWRLNGYFNKSYILVQDIGNGDDTIPLGEKWFAFDVEQEKMVEKHISFRDKMLRSQNVAEIAPSQTNT